MSISFDEIGAFREGTWQLECPKLRLVRRSKAKPHSISGAGDISLSPDRLLLLRLYGARAQRRDKALDRLHEELQLPAGSLLPESSYYDLEAVDSRGRHWLAKRLCPNIPVPLLTQTARPIVKAQVPSLQAIEPHTLRTDQYSLALTTVRWKCDRSARKVLRQKHLGAQEGVSWI